MTAMQVLAMLSSKRVLVVSTVFLLSTFAIRRDDFRETFRYSLQGAALVPIFCALFWSHARLPGLRDLLESSVARFIGKISYSLYLYHFLALSVCSALIANPVQMKVATLSAAFLLATLSYYLVENPMRAFGSNLAKGLDAVPQPQPGSE